MPWVTEPGTSHDETVRITTLASRELRTIPGIRTFGSHIGRAVAGEEIVGMNAAENWVSIDPAADYDKTVAAIQKAINGYPGLFHEVRNLPEREDR